MRGLPGHDVLLALQPRLVPAHAGVTRAVNQRSAELSARPRTCGGYPAMAEAEEAETRSSPHMRGLPGGIFMGAHGATLVPAHAGVTRVRIHSGVLTVTRPRTCGGYPCFILRQPLSHTSSPHMRGLPGPAAGTHPPGQLVPAHAGVTRGPDGGSLSRHPRPRTCGGYPGQVGWDPEHTSLVPAHAGVTRSPGIRGRGSLSRPRTCGGYPKPWYKRTWFIVSSPHMRGLPGLQDDRRCRHGLVPAHAGVTRH